MIEIQTLVNETEMNIKNNIEVNPVDALNYVLELEREICSLDRSFPTNLRNTVWKLRVKTAKDIYKERCNCSASSRKHLKYVYDWAS